MSSADDILQRWGLCPHCLAIKNYTTYVRVRFADAKGLSHYINADNATDPVRLSTWVYSYINNIEIDPDTLDFEINNYLQAFIPVAVINGTPVCPVHLWAQTK
jgi:hypothetical protein